MAEKDIEIFETFADLLKEKNAKEIEVNRSEELTDAVSNLVAEKGNLAKKINSLSMDNKYWKSKCEKLEEEFGEQGLLLETAKDNLRVLTEEKEKKRLRKRKGFGKLLFWK